MKKTNKIKLFEKFFSAEPIDLKNINLEPYQKEEEFSSGDLPKDPVSPQRITKNFPGDTTSASQGEVPIEDIIEKFARMVSPGDERLKKILSYYENKK
jgi:hypothetical protein